MPRKSSKIPDHLIYGVCERFLDNKEKWTADSLVDWLKRQGHATNRERIFPIIRQGIEKGFLRLCPPRTSELQQKLAVRYPSMPVDTRILDVQEPFVVENLASAAADLILELIHNLEQEKAGKSKTKERSVHIGFGGGRTTRRTAEHLARLLVNEPSVPPLTLHALSSGFATNRPSAAPVGFFSYFMDLGLKIDFVGLFTSPVVKCADYHKVKDLPGSKEAFAEARYIDIVVTSLAQFDDVHGIFNEFMKKEGGKLGVLKKAGHVGDVQWQPYSPTGPIEEDTGIRAVTIFDLIGLRDFVVKDGKHSVLIAGPCNACGATKEKALEPLLREPDLRVANHLVTDPSTVKELLKL